MSGDLFSDGDSDGDGDLFGDGGDGGGSSSRAVTDPVAEFLGSCGLSHLEAAAKGLGAAFIDDLREASDGELATAGFAQADISRLRAAMLAPGSQQQVSPPRSTHDTTSNGSSPIPTTRFSLPPAARSRATFEWKFNDAGLRESLPQPFGGGLKKLVANAADQLAKSNRWIGWADGTAAEIIAELDARIAAGKDRWKNSVLFCS